MHARHDQRVIPAAFEYVRADSADQAVALITEHGEDAKFLAGGMSLIPLMKLRLATPTVLVDVGRLHDLSYVRVDGDTIAIGALTRHRDARDRCRLAASAVRSRPSPHRSATTRSATAARSADRSRTATPHPICRPCCSPSTPSSSRAGRGGERTIPASEFFEGFLETALAPDELLVEIRVPATGSNGFSYQKFNRRAQDWAIVGALAVRANGSMRVGLVNMGSTPLRATAVEQALAGGASADDAAQQADAGTEPAADLNVSVEYRRHLAACSCGGRSRQRSDDRGGRARGRAGLSVRFAAEVDAAPRWSARRRVVDRCGARIGPRARRRRARP